MVKRLLRRCVNRAECGTKSILKESERIRNVGEQQIPKETERIANVGKQQILIRKKDFNITKIAKGGNITTEKDSIG